MDDAMQTCHCDHFGKVYLGAAVALPSIISSMKAVCARLWPSVHDEILILVLINLAVCSSARPMRGT
jgi:hypothetical protein